MRLTFLLLPGFGILAPQGPTSHSAAPFEKLHWRGPATGVQTAIAEGNPQREGPFTMVLKIPSGAWIQPHFHNVDKRLVVISGELLMGHGQAIDEAQATALRPGGVAVVRANATHYEGGKGDTIVALIANGPFTTTMISK